MGYIGNKRSVRSQEAIDEGLLTFSQLKAWQKRAVKANVVKPCEWHHTGKYYNQTYYYDPTDFADLNPKDFPPIKKQASKAPETWYVLVSADWGGTKKHPQIVGANVVVKNKITDRTRFANKYWQYGGHIEEFTSQAEAEEYAKTAGLK
ncbi:hypothetical protein [Limosilactobacillus gastricus]|uniref:hypothetical protein n=1 Tax=Limosilactobacillus gastricus TaxID=227942 RepID=UPI0026EBF4E2|nr:hypothetical protein [Limosilactobacillus gastricus]